MHRNQHVDIGLCPIFEKEVYRLVTGTFFRQEKGLKELLIRHADNCNACRGLALDITYAILKEIPRCKNQEHERILGVSWSATDYIMPKNHSFKHRDVRSRIKRFFYNVHLKYCLRCRVEVANRLFYHSTAE